MTILIALIWVWVVIILIGAFICILYLTIALYVLRVMFDLLEVLREKRKSDASRLEERQGSQVSSSE